MDLVRHDLGQSKKESRFPQKDTCLAIYSLAVNSGAPLERILSARFPWCAGMGGRAAHLVRGITSRPSSGRMLLDYDDLLLYWAEMLKDENIAAEIGARFDNILVDEYQDTNRLQAEILLQVEARWPWFDGGRRRCPGHLFLPRRNCSQHPRIS